MLVDEIKYQILHQLKFEPTTGQQTVIDTYVRFLTDRSPQVAMILRGSAGTGKTTLAAAMVRMLLQLKQRVMLLAPTGRAAKVFALHADHPAYTIHRRIYRQRNFDSSSGTFSLNYNKYHDMLFFVDEASMIPYDSLLDDLVQFVYSGQNCRMLLIGDKAQLPPVGEEESRALLRLTLESYGLTVYECDLNEVLRQSNESGILWNATRIRECTMNDGRGKKSEHSSSAGNSTHQTDLTTFKLQLTPRLITPPRIKFKGFPDICAVPGDELIESLASSYSKVGIDETMVVTRSNKRANVYNLGIRNTILGREEELTTGDRLMVVKNNYAHSLQQEDNMGADFIANGDTAVVQRVRNVRELYGFRFADVWLQFPDYEHIELQVTILLDTLQSEAPSLTHEQQEQLFNAVMNDYADLPTKGDRINHLRKDPYYNALQVKYAYAITCHKAQGGQWAHVYIDQGYMSNDMYTKDYIHWLYTAFTRATERLFLVNWQQQQTDESPQ